MRLSWCVVSALIMGLVFGSCCFGATINVPGDASTISAAVALANPGDRILIASGDYNETVTLTKSNVSIEAAPLQPTMPVVNGGQGGSVFAVIGATGILIHGLEITGGQAEQGGALHIENSQIHISDCFVHDNYAKGHDAIFYMNGEFVEIYPTEGDGGAIFLNNTTTIITSSRIVNNSARGGAISYSFPQIPADGKGGAIFASDSTVILQSSDFEGNTAVAGAGASAGNQWKHASGWGGAYYAERCNSSVTETMLHNNSSQASFTGPGDYAGPGWGALAYGGAVAGIGGQMIMTNVGVSSNSALGGRCGNLSNRYPPPFGSSIGRNGDGLGGGIYLSNCDSTIRQSSIFSNRAQGWDYVSPFGQGHGGAIYARTSPTFLENVTLCANITNTDSGAIFSTGSTVESINNTIAFNEQDNATSGTIHSDGTGPLTLKNTIVASAGNNLDGNMISLGHNLFDHNQPAYQLPSDIVAVNPMLLPAATTPSGLQVLPLASGSPAIDAGDSLGAPAYDEAGTTRPLGAGIDIGAYEHAAPPDLILVSPQDITTYRPGQSIDLVWISNIPTAGTAIAVELWQNGGQVWPLGTAWDAAGQGSNEFALPSNFQGTGFRLVIRSMWNPELFVQGNTTFNIFALPSSTRGSWTSYE